jgi:hypothetical protein
MGCDDHVYKGTAEPLDGWNSGNVARHNQQNKKIFFISKTGSPPIYLTPIALHKRKNPGRSR